MYCIGMIETQFFAYIQLIRHRLRLLNKLLIHFRNIQHSNVQNNRFVSITKVLQGKSHSFEYFQNENNTLGYLFKKPNINSLRYGFTFNA